MTIIKWDIKDLDSAETQIKALRMAVIKYTGGDLFWLGEILLSEIDSVVDDIRAGKEVAYK